MNVAPSTQPYVLGHSEPELIRLERQGQIFGAETRDVLRRAGIAPGMRVLDVGCGVGDVSMIAAEIVGQTGEVTGIDKSEQALASARARAARAGYHWLNFSALDLYAAEPKGVYDAVIGRFILMHIPDPVAALARLSRFLRAGGIVAFIEMDIEQAGAYPPMPLLDECVEWICATYRKVGAEPNMGSRLYRTFRAAGLEPRLSGSCRIESGPDSIVYEFAAETLKSLLPAMEAHNIATAEAVGAETIAQRLRQAAVAGDHCIFMPRLIGAWGTTRAVK